MKNNQTTLVVYYGMLDEKDLVWHCLQNCVLYNSFFVISLRDCIKILELFLVLPEDTLNIVFWLPTILSLREIKPTMATCTQNMFDNGIWRKNSIFVHDLNHFVLFKTVPG